VETERPNGPPVQVVLIARVRAQSLHRVSSIDESAAIVRRAAILIALPGHPKRMPGND
jgi:hypothetical protein